MKRTVVNRNSLVRRFNAVNGVKTGYTRRAGNVLVGSASRDSVTVISVVLGEPSERARDGDSLALLRYGLDSYNARTVLPEGRVLGRVGTAVPRRRTVEVIAGDTVKRVLRSGARTRTTVVRPADGGRRAAAARDAARHGRRARGEETLAARAGRDRAAGRRGQPRHAPGRHAAPLADDRRPGAAAGL